MDEPKDSSGEAADAPESAPAAPRSEREAKLAAALRANLRRRKAAARRPQR